MNARIAAFGVFLTACRADSTPVPEARADEPAQATGVAVVELFTSEGCSSCPPADAVLADIVRSSGRGTYALEFHVDYWDDLGWPDRFASPENTARQRAYARAFGTGGLYTPQMIVGGVEQFTGSDRTHATAAIARALAHSTNVNLSIRTRTAGRDLVAVDFEQRGAPLPAFFTVAVVERSAVTPVRAGENAGKTLHHTNVVRAFASLPLTSERGTLTIPLPSSFSHEDADVIAYLQRDASDGTGMPVLAATRSPVPTN